MEKKEEERRRATAYNRTVCVPLLSVAPGFRSPRSVAYGSFPRLTAGFSLSVTVGNRFVKVGVISDFLANDI
jgi:hypothetical protein